MLTFVFSFLESFCTATLVTFISFAFGGFSNPSNKNPYSAYHPPHYEFNNQTYDPGRNLKYLIQRKRVPRVQTSRTAKEYSFPYFDRYRDDTESKLLPKSNITGFSSDDSDSENDTKCYFKDIKEKLSRSQTKNNSKEQDSFILKQLWQNNKNISSHTNENSILPEEYQSECQYNFINLEDMKRLPSIENFINAAIASRILVFVIQYLSFNFLPHHTNDGFTFTPEEDYGTTADRLINSTFAGLANWDGQYFLHISTKGYTDENFMAFFPLYPMSVFAVSKLFYIVLFPFASFSSVALMVGILLNCLFFVSSVHILHAITKLCDRGLDNLSQVVVLFFCYNPASIFFSAFYTESMFSALTMSMLHSLLIRDFKRALVMASLSSLCRSNGMLNFGFIAAYTIRNALCDIQRRDFYLYFRIIRKTVVEFTMIAFGMIPFALFQIYGIRKFCDGLDVTPQLPEYCRNSFVLPYQYIQKNYWNVGFLNYFEPRQIPNFLLAAPVLLVTFYECFKRLRCYAWYIFEHKCYDCIGDFSMTVHGIFLTFFCFFCMHVQVSTRLILSACPYLYIYIAKTHRKEVSQYRKHEIDFPIFSTSVYAWAFGYYIVGTVMFSVGLPWT